MKFTSSKPLLLVGAGKMGGAMLSGWIDKGVDPTAILVSDPEPAPEMAEYLASKAIRHAASLPADLTPTAVLVAVKPQMMETVLPLVAPVVGHDTLVMSVAAGTTIAAFEAAFGDVPVVRAMPNTPAQVQRGMTALIGNDKVTADQRALVEDLLSSIGKVAWLDNERQMDAVTAVSGSGPAYVFLLAECLAQAGVEAGLPAELAATLARQTVAGAGELLYRSDVPAGTLRQNVTSPGGTTAAALAVLMANDGLQLLLNEAIAAAAKRSRELAG